ncbi:hypothetical protein [Amycolatopsis alba]|uniref:Uncharacterized protein n=1 Tax=Amycolatopsis alba DSM 44262 TaxID=1125972 RepID=A0A229RCW7_AMYAL|nr:hypothetical protein [Amycolatopsis alba]OXM44512.1 hypothetical protein CFP75_34365 [Amycolatopsis alba DSM 44262]
MSRKNRTTSTAPIADATDGGRHLHAVSDAPGTQNTPTTEDKVRAALTANPASTTAALAMTAGVGRSTAAKILARWGRNGTAIRTAGDGPRNPDTWALAPSDRDATPGIEDTRPDTTASDTADGTEAAAETTSNTDGATIADTTAAQDTTGSDADHDAEPHATDTTDDKAGPVIAADVENDTNPAPDTAPGDPADSTTGTEPSAAEPPAIADTNRPDKDRLPKGGLRAMVEEYLTEHQGEDFGPAKIGKDLGRSGGAVNNALEKLVADGYAIKTCEAPKRFAINPDKTDVPNTNTDAAEPALKA